MDQNNNNYNNSHIQSNEKKRKVIIDDDDYLNNQLLDQIYSAEEDEDDILTDSFDINEEDITENTRNEIKILNDCINKLYPNTITNINEINQFNDEKTNSTQYNIKNILENIGINDILTKPNKQNVYSFYSFKGGVGKTSLLLQLAIDLTKMGKKILILDLDPQCNTTIYLKNRKNEKEKYNDYLSDIVKANNNYDVKKVIKYHIKEKTLRPLKIMNEWNMINILKETYFQQLDEDINNIELNGTQSIKSILNHIWSLNYLKYEEEFKNINYNNYFLENLGLISGSIEIEQIVEKMNSDGRFLIMTRLFFIEVLKNFDYIFIDLNPGLSKINKLMMLCSDKIITPIGNDPFSMASVVNLPKILKQCYMQFFVEIDNTKKNFIKYFNNVKFDFMVNINYKISPVKKTINLIEKEIAFLEKKIKEYDDVLIGKSRKIINKKKIDILKREWNREEWKDFCKNGKEYINDKLNKYCYEYNIDRKTIDNEINIETVGFTQMMYVLKNIIFNLKEKRKNCFCDNFDILARLPNYNQQITVMHRFGVTYEESLKYDKIMNISISNSKKYILPELNKLINHMSL